MTTEERKRLEEIKEARLCANINHLPECRCNECFLVSTLEAEAKEVERLQFRLNFYDTPGDPTKNDGWCAEHPKRFQADVYEDGDECQICRAEAAEAERDKLAERVKRLENVLPEYSKLVWKSICDMAALIADPQNPDWMPVLGASNKADARCLQDTYDRLLELRIRLETQICSALEEKP